MVAAAGKLGAKAGIGKARLLTRPSAHKAKARTYGPGPRYPVCGRQLRQATFLNTLVTLSLIGSQVSVATF